MSKNILWIDDDERLIDSSIPVFLKYGFQIFKATNISRALVLLKNESIDGVLLDKRLAGDEKGMELLDFVKHQFPKLKVAIFTAFPEYDEQVKYDNLGAVAYLQKVDKSIPADPEKQRSFFNALHYVFQVESDKSLKPDEIDNNNIILNSHLWNTGLFFIIMFITVVGMIWLVSKNIPILILPIVLISSFLFYAIIGATILRVNKQITEKSFLKLMLDSFKLLPLLKDKKEKLHSNK